MGKRNGNREVRKPKQDKKQVAEAPSTISALGSKATQPGRRR